MALSSKVQKLVTAKKWKEAYDNASSDRVSTVDNSYLVQVTNLSSDEEGYLKGGATNYSLVDDAEDATSLSEKEAKKIVKTISDKKQIKTLVIKRGDVIQEVGSQGTEKGEVIELFIESRFPNIDTKTLKEILIKWIEELGFSYNTNPFLQFVDEYVKKNQAIDLNTLEIINDLYSNNEIETTDLQAKTSEGTNSLLFNKNLYDFSYDDAEFIIQAYKWLSNSYNIKRYLTNVDALTKYGITEAEKIDNKKAEEIRDQIIFVTSQTPSNSAINTVADIQREIRFLEAGGTKKVSDENAEKIISISGIIKNEQKWRDITPTNVTTAQEAQDLINYLAKEFKLV